MITDSSGIYIGGKHAFVIMRYNNIQTTNKGYYIDLVNHDMLPAPETKEILLALNAIYGLSPLAKMKATTS